MPTKRFRIAALGLLFAAAACTGNAKPKVHAALTGSPTNLEFTIHLLPSTLDERLDSDSYLNGSQLAAAELSKNRVLGRKVRLIFDAPPKNALHPLAGTYLAQVADDHEAIGALTVDGSAYIDSANEVLTSTQLPVFELRDDRYERGELASPVFQMAIPHSWQAWRLARYFGPGDRGYKRVVLFMPSGGTYFDPRRSEVEAGLLRYLGERGVQFSTQTFDVNKGPDLEALKQTAADAVVIEGLIQSENVAMVKALSAEPYRYKGRSHIHDGWRPQITGFDSLLRINPDLLPPGSVAVSDYARPSAQADTIEVVHSFRAAFSARFHREPSDVDVAGYEAVLALGEAVKRAGSNDHFEVVKQLEKFDRVRFGHISTSFGPTDHVAPERDVLGLWALSSASKDQDPWRHLMRTFTSDLERTDIFDQDWAAFFDGTTPGGEAPFFYTAKHGIVTDSKDDLQ